MKAHAGGGGGTTPVTVTCPEDGKRTKILKGKKNNEAYDRGGKPSCVE